ncbi:hypothetical protein [Microtetraspora malaysiensis]|uniref:hypothetical protein n=1 Tax=Microtetraspora malaysiensis TaxID=161358 RepID=UPI003D9169CB
MTDRRSGSGAPLAAVALTEATGGAGWPVGLMTIGLSAITFLALLAAPETRHVDMVGAASHKADGAEESDAARSYRDSSAARECFSSELRASS